MKIHVQPLPSLPVFSEDLQFVIHVGDGDASVPELFLEDGLPRPDRHLLVGMAQSILMALEEADPETVAFLDSCAIRLDRSGETKPLDRGLIVVRSTTGKFGALVTATPREARRLARKAVRWFTGAIRLDIP
jgi:hypothetical protein